MVDASEPSDPSPEPDAAERRAADDRNEPEDVETVRRRVEEKYDFDNFTPADMAAMTVEEWEAAFDADTWITGADLLDRVEAELRSRVASRDLFAVVERTVVDGTEHVLAYTDAGYALVDPDGTVEGDGSILADVEPVVALCSMEDFEVTEPPADGGLPDPDSIPDETGGLGDRLVLALAVVQVVAGLLLLLSPLVVDLDAAGAGSGGALLTTIAGLGFLFIGIVLGVIVANARLSGRFRAAEYRERLRAAGVGSDERPAFLPGEPVDDGGGSGSPDSARESAGAGPDERAESAPD